VECLGGAREVDERLRPLLAQERGEVVAARYASDVFDVRLGEQRRRQDRADFAAVARDGDFD
jgi:hypothetical protein